MYSTDGHYHSRSRAMGLIKAATRSGLLVRPSTCELCDKNPVKIKNEPIHAHHWNGYDNPLDVWWLCKSCNGYLIGEDFHTGKVSKEEAIRFIKARIAERYLEPKAKELIKVEWRPEPMPQCMHMGIHRGVEGRCKRLTAHGDYCIWHDPDQRTCQGFNNNGSHCTRKVSGTSTYCRWHRQQAALLP